MLLLLVLLNSHLGTQAKQRLFKADWWPVVYLNYCFVFKWAAYLEKGCSCPVTFKEWSFLLLGNWFFMASGMRFFSLFSLLNVWKNLTRKGKIECISEFKFFVFWKFLTIAYENSSYEFFTLVFGGFFLACVLSLKFMQVFLNLYLKYVHTICNELSCAIHFRNMMHVVQPFNRCCVILLGKK